MKVKINIKVVIINIIQNLKCLLIQRNITTRAVIRHVIGPSIWFKIRTRPGSHTSSTSLWRSVWSKSSESSSFLDSWSVTRRHRWSLTSAIYLNQKSSRRRNNISMKRWGSRSCTEYLNLASSSAAGYYSSTSGFGICKMPWWVLLHYAVTRPIWMILSKLSCFPSW